MQVSPSFFSLHNPARETDRSTKSLFGAIGIYRSERKRIRYFRPTANLSLESERTLKLGASKNASRSPTPCETVHFAMRDTHTLMETTGF